MKTLVVTSESIVGAPQIRFLFGDLDVVAECRGLRLVGAIDEDESVLLRILDDAGSIFTELRVFRRFANDSLADAVIAVGSALLWTCWQCVEAAKTPPPVAEVIGRWVRSR